MTPKERSDFDRQTRPPRFTGLHRGRYYYKGLVWDGPSNLIGARHLKPFKLSDEARLQPKGF
jgi:hypothetical protein